MAQLTSRLVISLIDRVSGPAKAVKASLAGILGMGGARGGIGAAMASQVATMRHSAATASAAVAAPLALMGRAGFEAAYGLEKVMNNVQAVGMLSDEQRASLKGYIQDLNKSFPFINKEIGEAAFELFRAGFTYEQAMGALKGTLLLAQAGDIGRQEAADIATNVLTAMRLPMQTTEQAAASMARVNDVLAYAANKSNTDVRLLGETFKYVAPLAASAGMSIEQVAAAAMTMANNGIKGSEAGVAMRAAIVRMAKPTKDMMATLERHKINLKDFIKGGRQITADDVITGLLHDGINASGQRKAIEALLKDKVLALKPGQLTANLVDLIAKDAEGAADKNVLAQTIGDILTASGKHYDLLGLTRAMREKGFGVAEIARVMEVRQGARVLTLLLDDVEKKAREVEAGSKGAAQKMADIRMKGIVGEVARLAAAWENLWVTIGDAGVLATLGQAFDRVAQALTSMAQSSPAALRGVTYALMGLAVIGPIGLLLQGVGATMAMVGASARIAALGVLFLGRSLLVTAPAAAWAGLVGTMTALGAAARAARSAVAGLAVATMLAGPGGIARIAGGAALAGAASIIAGLGASLAGIAAVGAAAVAVVGAIAVAGAFIYQNWAGLGSFFEGFAEGFMVSLGPAKPLIDGIVSGLSGLADLFVRITGPLDETGEKWKSWGHAAGAAVGSVVAKVAELVGWIGKLLDTLTFGLAGRAGSWLAGKLGLGGGGSTPLPNLSLLPGVGADGAASPGTSPAAGSAAASGSGAQTPAAAASEAQTVTVAVRSAMDQVRSIVSQTVGEMHAMGVQLSENLAAGIRAGAPAIGAAMNEAVGAQVRGAVRGSFSDGGIR